MQDQSKALASFKIPKNPKPLLPRPETTKKPRLQETPIKPIPALADVKEAESIENELAPATGKHNPISNRALHQKSSFIDHGTDWWLKDPACPPLVHESAMRDMWPPEQPGCWVNYCATNKVPGKAFLQIEFFPWPKLFPAMENVFATRDKAEIRLYRVDGDRGLTHIATTIDSTANATNPPAPKRPEREYFLTLTWSFAWWYKDELLEEQDQGRGLPILLAGGDRGVVHVFSGYTLELLQTCVGHGGPISCISVSPQYPWMIATASHDRALRIWNLSIPVQPCVAILGGIGGHTKEILSCAWHPTKNMVASTAIDRRIKVWPISKDILKAGWEESLFNGHVDPEEQNDDDKMVLDPEVSTSKTRSGRSRRAIQVHNPVANTWLIHEDHPDQIEWLDEIRILSKARTGRNGKDIGRRGGNCAEVIVWRFDIIKEIVMGTCGEGLGTGIIAFPGHEGALRLLKRFVIPKQGFWGRTMGFDGESKAYLPYADALWEVDVLQAPAYFGLKSRPPADLCPEVDGYPDAKAWEQLARLDLHSIGEKRMQLIACGVSPAGDFVVASGDDGYLFGFRKLGVDEAVR